MSFESCELNMIFKKYKLSYNQSVLFEKVIFAYKSASLKKYIPFFANLVL